MNYFNILKSYNDYEFNNKKIIKEDIDNNTFIIKLYKNDLLYDTTIFYINDYDYKDFILMINDYIEEFIKS